jgi:tetratricopeptide (TPR) repeat protein
MKRSLRFQTCLVVLLLALIASPVYGHTDLELQIEALNEQIELEGTQADLLLKRANLYRRHEDWDKAAFDFITVRGLDPAQPEVDWIEGLYMVDTDQWQEADELISRFIDSNKSHAAAHHVRGRARWKLGRFSDASDDYQSAINLSPRPSPSLYRSHIISELSAGPESYASATASVQAGLNHFPREISLLGLAVDLALVQSDGQAALNTMMRLPGRLQELMQWKFRRAAWQCIQGNEDRAKEAFNDMLTPSGDDEKRRAGTFDLSPEEVGALAGDPTVDKCTAAVSALLAKLQP